MTTTISPALTSLDPAWLTGVLGATVATVRVEPLAFTGATTDLARLRLTYREDTASGPPTVIAKITGADEVRAGMDAAMGLFAREGHFYTEFADQIPLRSPRCYHVGDGTTTPLLLEDLGHLRMGDQIAGLTPTDAERIIDRLAALHARFWEAPELSADWLVDPASGTYGRMVVHLVSSGASALADRFAGQGFDDVLATVVARAPDWGVVLEHGVSGPKTLTHNDVRLDNIFFDHDGEPIFVDWQAPARTRGTQDIANLLTQSMAPDVLSDSWEPLLLRYHGALQTAGVTDYSWEDCLLHYRQNAPYALGAAMALMGAMAIDDGRGLGETIAIRALGHLQELDSFNAL